MTRAGLWLHVAGASIGWALLVLDALPPTTGLVPDRAVILAALLAGVFSVCLLIRPLMLPLEEVFDAGRNYERRQMMKDTNRRAKVVRWRRLDDSDAAG